MNARQKGCPLSGPSFACPVNGSLGGLPERVFFWELHQSDDLEVRGHGVLIGSQERQRPIVRILPEDRGDPNDRRSSVEILRGLRPVKCIRNQTRLPWAPLIKRHPCEWSIAMLQMNRCSDDGSLAASELLISPVCSYR